MVLTADDLDGYARTDIFADDTLVRVSVRRTTDSAYPSGWRYTLHYGALAPDPPQTLADGTIRRYDNAHEDTKGHELHVAPDPNLQTISSFQGWSTSTNGSARDTKTEVRTARQRRRYTMTTDHDRTDHETKTVLLITVRKDNEGLYEEGHEAIEALDRGEPVEQPDRLTFPSETMLAQTFNEWTLRLLRVITDAEPASIRETARLVERDVKNVHEELTRLEAMGVIRFVEEGRSKRPVFPYDELVITVPFGHRSDDGTDRVLASG